MARARNKVISGDYERKFVGSSFGKAYISLSPTKLLYLDSSTVEDIVPLDGEEQVSIASAAMRGLIGELILGPAGLLAAATAKQNGVHLVGIRFKDGKRCVIEVNDKIYKTMLVSCF